MIELKTPFDMRERLPCVNACLENRIHMRGEECEEGIDTEVGWEGRVRRHAGEAFRTCLCSVRSVLQGADRNPIGRRSKCRMAKQEARARRT